MSVKAAATYYSEENLAQIQSIDAKVHRPFQLTPSLRTLEMIINDGDTWWAPVLDVGYKSDDGRDLNLEVINSMMVCMLKLMIL